MFLFLFYFIFYPPKSRKVCNLTDSVCVCACVCLSLRGVLLPLSDRRSVPPGSPFAGLVHAHASRERAVPAPPTLAHPAVCDDTRFVQTRAESGEASPARHIQLAQLRAKPSFCPCWQRLRACGRRICSPPIKQCWACLDFIARQRDNVLDPCGQPFGREL